MDAAIASTVDAADSLHAILKDGEQAFHWLGEFLKQQEQRPLVVAHHFAPGVYIREMRIPSGTVLAGVPHLFEHSCTCEGDIEVWSLLDGEVTRRRLTGRQEFTSHAGAQRIGLAHIDTVFCTAHPNPDDCRDVEALELRIVGRVIDPIYKVAP